MNIEEYKYEIIKQLRTPNSPMRTLMVHRRMSERTGNSIYKDAMEFKIPHWGFKIAVNRVEKERDTGFSVCFEENEPSEYLYPKAEDLQSYAWLCRFRCERVQITNQLIVLSIESFEMWIDTDYLPYKTEFKTYDKIVFVLDTLGSLAWHNPTAFDKTLEAWRATRKNNQYGYVEYEYDGEAEAQLQDFLEKNRVKNALGDEIKAVFNGAVIGAQESSMIQIAEGLRSLFKKY